MRSATRSPRRSCLRRAPRCSASGGLTFIAVAVFASPALLADERKRWRFLPVIGAVGLLAVLAVFGAIRLALAPTEMVDGVRLRIMQPNVQQDEKFNYRNKGEVMRRYLDLSQGAASGIPLDGITHLIWPELAFPFFLTREPEALATIAKMLPPTTVLITGAARARRSGSRRPRRARLQLDLCDRSQRFDSFDLR